MKLMYTGHARSRMRLRYISKKEIMEALELGEYDYKGGNKFIIEYNRVVAVVVEEGDSLVIITVYHSKPFHREAMRYQRANKTSLRQSVRRLKDVA